MEVFVMDRHEYGEKHRIIEAHPIIMGKIVSMTYQFLFLGVFHGENGYKATLASMQHFGE
jgi:hypothetical protein